MKKERFTTIRDRICLAMWPLFFTLISVVVMFGVSFFSIHTPYGDGYPRPSRWEVLEIITPGYLAILIGTFFGGVIFVAIIAAIIARVKHISYKETFLNVYKRSMRISLPFIALVSVFLLVMIICFNI